MCAMETKTDKALNMSDPAGTIVSSLVGLAGTLGLLSKLDLSADELAAILGWLAAVAAAARTLMERRRRARHVEEVAVAKSQAGAPVPSE